MTPWEIIKGTFGCFLVILILAAWAGLGLLIVKIFIELINVIFGLDLGNGGLIWINTHI